MFANSNKKNLLVTSLSVIGVMIALGLPTASGLWAAHKIDRAGAIMAERLDGVANALELLRKDLEVVHIKADSARISIHELDLRVKRLEVFHEN